MNAPPEVDARFAVDGVTPQVILVDVNGWILGKTKGIVDADELLRFIEENGSLLRRRRQGK